MSHTGNRSNRNYIRYRRDIDDYKPTRVEIPNPLEVKATHDGDEFDGEFQGNGERVLIGLCNGGEFAEDDNEVFDGAQRGIAIGYTPNSVYFNIYSNDGTSSGVSIIPLSTIKDENYHTFNIKIVSDNKITVRFDGQENILTSNIPSFSDNLKLITSGLY